VTYWKTQENRVKHFLEERGWKRVRRNPASGALPIPKFKNDVWGDWKGQGLSIDHKSTRGKKQITLIRSDLEKAVRDANANKDIGMVSFGFLSQRMLWGVMPLADILLLVENATSETLEKIHG